MTRMRRGIVAGLVTGLVVALAAVPAPVLAGSPTGAVGHGSAYGVASGTIAPVVDLAPGRGDARVQVTRNGRFGIVHQGSSYDPQALHKVDLRTNRVTGSVPVPADSDSALAVRGNRFAYTIEGRNLWVTDIGKAKPRRVRKVGFRVNGKRATLFDVVVAPNGKVAYVTADDWIHTPGSHVLVLALRKNGVPKLVRRVPVAATHLAISRNSKRLVAADGRRIHVIDVRKPRRARRVASYQIRDGDIRAAAFGKGANALFVLSASSRYVVSRIHLGKRKSLRRVLTADRSIGAGGGIAVNRAGNRVLVTSTERDEKHPSTWVLGPKLGVRRAVTGPCLPGGAAASLGGPTRGRLYVADSGICDQARLWRVRP